MIPLRSPAEIDAIARAGSVVDRVLTELLRACTPGVATRELDSRAREHLRQHGAVALFPGVSIKNQPPFPAAVCVCVNEEVTHGVPGDRVLQPGDLVCVDLGASVDGWCADASRATVVGEHSPARAARQALLAAAHAANRAGVTAIAPGVRWSDVADAVRRAAELAACRVAPGFAGHGIGRSLHEPPRAPMFLGPRDDFILRPGMVLTVEPILLGPPAPSSAASAESRQAGPACLTTRIDGWTVATTDGSEACQIEETVAVVRGGVRVLTSSGVPPLDQGGGWRSD